MIADDSDHSCDRLNYDQRQLVDDYVAYLRHTNIYYEFVDNNDLINSYKTLKNIIVNEKVLITSMQTTFGSYLPFELLNPEYRVQNRQLHIKLNLHEDEASVWLSNQQIYDESGQLCLVRDFYRKRIQSSIKDIYFLGHAIKVTCS